MILQAHSRQDLQCFEDTEMLSLVDDHVPFRLAQVKASSSRLKDLGGEKLAQAAKEVRLPEEYSDFSDLFDLDYSRSPPVPSHGAVCTIQTTDNKLPPPGSPIPLSSADRAEKASQLQKLIGLGRIEPSASPTAAGSFFVN